ncbi:hypothetical protein RND71_011809 [Anisodus tanguticus]|uniref:BZIP domain-containing protein n=1 Tax=Anisodus tanguticus TaxID=243964 RepID=A0AAE1VGE4_9SOLA|nr:hypothetical protein RND71_011809 [Anisodus tanguticus]
MGAGEESTPTKLSKPASTQAYYNAGATPPFFASPVTSPAPHPYLWGGQHPLMPPYGTPVPYPALYPPTGVYARPNMATTPNTAQANPESDGKGPEGKDRNSSKKVKASSGGTAGDSGKVTSGSGNDGATQSDESRSESTSDTNDENDNHVRFCCKQEGKLDQILADGASAQTVNYLTSIHGNPVTVPATNLNIGMDVWNASSGAIKNSQMRLDERELKRQKRKQSNRESARRSRLHKQAECEELQLRVEALSNENHSLKDELQRVSEECEKLTSENNSIKEELMRWCGPDAVSKLESNGNAAHVQSNVEEAS